MAHNLCSGNAYSPAEHTLFLGCSIKSFTINVGWNEQIGELTVNLYEDTCAVSVGGNAKVYYDSSLNRQTTTGADPGFITPNIGAPVYFRVGNFEWCGLVQQFEEVNSESSYPSYTVKLIDPRQILEGTQIIIGDYANSVYGIPNLINAYGFFESFGFGYSQINDNGMPWWLISAATQRLTAALSPISNIYSPYGRLVFRDGYGTPGGSGVGYGIIPGDGGASTYILDMNELPIAPTYWKLGGVSVSLMDTISEICSEAAYDYYIELLPVIYSGSLYKVIKVRTVNRVGQPDLTQISDFIGSLSGIKSSQNVGQEMRNEPVSAFVVGGSQQGIYEAYQITEPTTSSDIITPFFGLDPLTGNAIEPVKVGDYWQFNVSTAFLNRQLTNPINSAIVTITEPELLAALGGFDAWQTDGAFNATDLYTKLILTQSRLGIYNPNILAAYSGALISSTSIPTEDLINLVKDGYFSTDDSDDINDARDLQIAYNFVLSFAEEYYGKKFMVRLPPSFTATLDVESDNIITSDIPSDGGWTDSSYVLGLNHPSIYTDFFSLQDNRLGCFAGIAVSGLTEAELKLLDPNNTLIVPNFAGYSGIYIRAQAEPDIVYLNASTLSSPRIVITLSNPVMKKQSEDFVSNARNAVGGLPALFRNYPSGLRQTAKSIIKNIGGRSLWMYTPNRPLHIEAVSIPIRSNIQVYGPWYASAAYGITHMIQDEGLVPWEYGGTSNMSLAGATRALNETGSAMQIGEMGAITVPGYPTIPPGAEIGAYNAGVFGAGTHLVENRSFNSGVEAVSSGGFVYTNVGPPTGWSGLYGPNITSISVDVSDREVNTTYTMRSFTPQFGRFSRTNADRFKRESQRRVNRQKLFRFNELNRARLANTINRAISASNLREKLIDKGKANVAATPHGVLCGQSFAWTSGVSGIRRSSVISEKITDIGSEFFDNYGSKAFMSMDGLLRPISLFGDGGLPRFANAAGSVEGTLSVGSIPPIATSGGSGLYSLNISNNYLNPLLSTEINGGAYIYGNASGHDISILGYGNNAPSGSNQSLNMFVAGTGTPMYRDDYRFLGLRGPLVVHGWGFDLDGKPIPNKVDTETNASGGVFTATGLKDTFMDNWLTKSYTWPVGPIDLRWDRQRAVWTIPTYRLMLGSITSGISQGGIGSCRLLTGDNLYDSQGNPLIPGTGAQAPKFDVTDILECLLPVSGKILTYYEPQQNKYYGISPNSRMIIGKLDSELGYGGSTTMSIWAIGATGNFYDTGQNVTIYDWLLKPGETIPANGKAIAELEITSNKFVLTEAQCPTSG